MIFFKIHCKWEDYYVVMAYQLLYILMKKNPEDKKFAEGFI